MSSEVLKSGNDIPLSELNKITNEKIIKKHLGDKKEKDESKVKVESTEKREVVKDDVEVTVKSENLDDKSNENEKGMLGNLEKLAKSSSPFALIFAIFNSFINKDFSSIFKDMFGDKAEEIKATIVDGNIKENKDIKLDNFKWTKLEELDLRPFSKKYPREASLKNNNPAGLTWSKTFANTLSSHGINFIKGTSRPNSEGGNYFAFTNMRDGMNAFDLLWKIKENKMGDKTFGDFAKNWAVDYSSYKTKFAHIWNSKLSTLSVEEINEIKYNQMRIESPGMHKILSKNGYINV